MSPRERANTERVSVFFSESVLDALKALSSEKGTTVSGLVRMIVLQYLAKKR